MWVRQRRIFVFLRETETYCVLDVGETETYRVRCGCDRDVLSLVWVKRQRRIMLGVGEESENKKDCVILDTELTILLCRVGAG